MGAHTVHVYHNQMHDGAHEVGSLITTMSSVQRARRSNDLGVARYLRFIVSFLLSVLLMPSAVSVTNPPSLRPSLTPRTTLSNVLRPVGTPLMASSAPTQMPATASNSNPSILVPVVAAITVFVGVFILVALVMFYRRRKTTRSQRAPTGNNSTPPARRPYVVRDNNYDMFSHHQLQQQQQYTGTTDAPTMSVLSDQSTHTRSERNGGSKDEGVDVFDQYKDQNLETMRSNVENNLSDFEGIMSAAVTKALMGDEDAQLDPDELLWGCRANPIAADVEASALCEVSDWLKRNESASDERKRWFMQDILNKMVASVRFGVLDADDASRTIHESAALLGLEIANDLPMTTVLVSGMRKKVERSEIVKALGEFGDIDTSAVSSGERGFGIIRFRNPKSVERALRRYRNAEIVVQDVAVQIKVLMPSGEVLSRA